MKVVLVRPEHAANVGAVARVIRNTGLDGLVLVAPGDWRTTECWRTAWGAQEVLEAATVFASLAEALADATYTVAFSGRHGTAVLDVREAAAEIAGLAPSATACLVFGPETTGLTAQEIALCGRHATIPSHPDQPSFNLSHAVAIAAYEVFRRAPAAVAPEGPAPLATHATKDAALGLLRLGFAHIGLLPDHKPDNYFREWVQLVQRAPLSPREVRLLEQLAYRMKKQPR